MFADIVPEQLRSTVYAFDRSFEGAVAACAAPLVGEPPFPQLHPHTRTASCPSQPAVNQLSTGCQPTANPCHWSVTSCH